MLLEFWIGLLNPDLWNLSVRISYVLLRLYTGISGRRWNEPLVTKYCIGLKYVL
jgi:hypothetical protein